MSNPQKAISYACNNQESFLKQLFDILRIPSISTRPEHDGDIRAAVEWLADNMRGIGLENVTIYETAGHPILYADWLHAPNQPTVLFYGHYDVQPADNLELWGSPPFEPEIRKENVYARGCSDDKGQVMVMLKAVESYLQGCGSLPVNVKFILEGEEEVGGHSIKMFIPEHKGLLSADVAYVADTAMAGFGQPAIIYGLRGIAALNIDVCGPRLDLHSGSYGGAIDNPINVLSHILACLKDPNGTVKVPHFYDDVLPLEDEERELLAEQHIDEESWLRWTGAPQLWGEPQFSRIERLGARPTLEINGIFGGYTGDGAKTIIPHHAHAKISMRLVPNQDPEQILQLVTDYIYEIAPDTVRINVTPKGTAPASISDRSHPAMQAATQACQTIWDVEPIFKREGGSIPVVAQLQQDLGVETVLLGFGLPHDRLHAPNERFYLPNYRDGIKAIIHFLANYAT